MITHKVIDLVYTEDEGNTVLNGNLTECNEFISSQHDSFTYKILPLLPSEIQFLNEYENALKQGNKYLKTGKLFVLLIALIFVSCTKENVTAIPKGNVQNLQVTFTIGQHYAGGIIFYIDSTNIHGLIADTADLKPSTWWNGSYTMTDALKRSIGYGDRNTDRIITSQGDSGKYAARRCAKSTINGYTDWFLPSRDELNEMYKQKNVIGGFDTTSGIGYWSSTEDKDNYQLAWLQYFSGGAQGNQFKNFVSNVRAIRKF